MTTELTTTTDLIILEPLPLDQHPAAVYVAGLAHGSRRTMRAALDKIADMLIAGANALTINWAALRNQHTVAIRSKLAELYGAATTNKMLSALRGCLKAAWRLGQISSDGYSRAVDFDRIEGSTLPARGIMIISVDIPLFDAPWGGLRVEDGFRITQAGVERLNTPQARVVTVSSSGHRFGGIDFDKAPLAPRCRSLYGVLNSFRAMVG